MKKFFTLCFIFAFLHAIQSNAKDADIIINDGYVQFRLVHGSSYNPSSTDESEFWHYAVLDKILDYSANGLTLPNYILHEGISYPVLMIDDKAFSSSPSLTSVTIGKNSIFNDIDCITKLSSIKSEIPLTFYPFSVCSLSEFSVPYWSSLGSGTSTYGFMPYLRSIPATAFDTELTVTGSNSEWGAWGRFEDELVEINIGCSIERIYVDRPDNDVVNRWDTGVDKFVVNCMNPIPPEITYFNIGSNTAWGANQNIEIHVPAGCQEEYENAEGWKDLGEIIADLDFAGNHVIDYALDGEIIYGLDESGEAYVIGSKDREISGVYIKENVYFPGRGYVDVTRIGTAAFKDCKYLYSMTLPESGKLIEIGDMAFMGCSLGKMSEWSASTYYLPESIEKIGDYAFNECPAYLQGLPNNLKWIGDHNEVLYTENSSTPVLPYQLYIPENLEYIGNNCQYLSGWFIFSLPETIKYLGSVAFRDYANTSWSNNQKRYGELDLYKADIETLSSMNSLALNKSRRVILPSKLKTLSLSRLSASTVIASKNLETIQEFSIICDDLYLLGENPPKIWGNSINYYNTPLTVHVKKGSLEKYKSDAVWSKFENIVEDIDYTYFADENFEYVIDLYNQEAIVIGSNDIPGKCIIPESVVYGGIKYPVTCLESSAHINKASVELPSTIKCIENNALYDATEIRCYATVPPELASAHSLNTWGGSSRVAYVPDESIDAYVESDWGKSGYTIKGLLQSGILSAEISEDMPVEIFNLNGVKVFEGVINDANLGSGIYVVGQNGTYRKIYIK